MITKFIQVAHQCLRLGNMYSVFTIIGALTFPQIQHLKRAWSDVPSKIKALQVIQFQYFFTPFLNVLSR